MLLDVLFAQACTEVFSSQVNACSTVLRATTHQIGIYQDVDFAERKIREAALNKAIKTVGKNPLAIAAGVIKIYQDKGISGHIIHNSDGFIPSVHASVSLNAVYINLGWRFK